jgi:hypothetical protein
MYWSQESILEAKKKITIDDTLRAVNYFINNDDDFNDFLLEIEQMKVANLIAQRFQEWSSDHRIVEKEAEIYDKKENEKTVLEKMLSKIWREARASALENLSKDKVAASAAMVHQNRPRDGGIDLNSGNMHMGIHQEGQGVQMHFDPAMIQRIRAQGFDGLEFKIDSIVPLTDLPVLLGLESGKEEQLALLK